MVGLVLNRLMSLIIDVLTVAWFGWLIDWLVGWRFDWLIDWLIDWSGVESPRDDGEMDPEVAKRLLVEGATLVLLGSI